MIMISDFSKGDTQYMKKWFGFHKIDIDEINSAPKHHPDISSFKEIPEDYKGVPFGRSGTADDEILCMSDEGLNKNHMILGDTFMREWQTLAMPLLTHNDDSFIFCTPEILNLPDLLYKRLAEHGYSTRVLNIEKQNIQLADFNPLNFIATGEHSVDPAMCHEFVRIILERHGALACLQYGQITHEMFCAYTEFFITYLIETEALPNQTLEQLHLILKDLSGKSANAFNELMSVARTVHPEATCNQLYTKLPKLPSAVYTNLMQILANMFDHIESVGRDYAIPISRITQEKMGIAFNIDDSCGSCSMEHTMVSCLIHLICLHFEQAAHAHHMRICIYNPNLFIPDLAQRLQRTDTAYSIAYMCKSFADFMSTYADYNTCADNFQYVVYLAHDASTLSLLFMLFGKQITGLLPNAKNWDVQATKQSRAIIFSKNQTPIMVYDLHR